MTDQSEHHEDRPKLFNPQITLGSLMVAASLIVSLVFYFAKFEKENAVQDTRIENNLRLIEKGLEAERRQTNISDEEIKRQVERNQQDVRARLDSMDKKLDKLVGWGEQ